MNTQTTPIAVLVAELRSAKAVEAAANKCRLDLESQIVARFPVPDGGEGTHKDEEFSIAFKVTRKVDTEALQVAWQGMTPNAQKAFKWAATVDLKQYRAIADLDPASYSQLAAFVTTTPAKPALTLKDANV